ncbi:MAG: IclR family transcriptional regulator [Steroidobacteraceae bacterium]
MARTQPIHSVVTTLDIIEHMAKARGPVGISELALAVGMPKPRIYRHLRTLLSRGYVSQQPQGDKYRLTLRLSHIACAIAEQTEFQVEARLVMPALRERAGQSVAIGQIEDDGVRVIDILPHRSAVEISSRPGTLFDFHCTAQGKVALAFGPPGLWQKLQRAPLRRWTDATITDLDRLKAEIDRVRKRGWAVAPGEIMGGINALAAPIFDSGGALAGTIGILGSIHNLAPRPAPGLLAAVLDAAAELSRRLGFREAATS